MATTASERLWKQLRHAYDEADKPTLSQLTALADQLGLRKRGTGRSGQFAAGASTIHDWLNAKSVPAPECRTHFRAVVQFLEARARHRGSEYRPVPPGLWDDLLLRARAERDAARGGRPAARREPEIPAPVTLPAPPVGFTDREFELRETLGWLEPHLDLAQVNNERRAPAVSMVTGMGGVGKTGLALHAAHRAKKWFPAGALFADLRGYIPGQQAEAGAVAGRFLRALGVKEKDLPLTDDGKCDAWQMALQGLARDGRPLLVVLDNVRTSGQVSHLLPSPPHRAIVTTRHRLSGPLASARRVDLGPLPMDDAVGLLERVLHEEDPDNTRVVDQSVDARRLAELCGGLPLALRICASLLRDESARPLASLVAELGDARTRLDALHYDDTDEHGRPMAVRATFELSYQHLTEQHRKAFRLLSAAPGPDISTESANALLGAASSRRLLADLARAQLLQGAGERWSMHDLIRLYAHESGLRHADEDGRATALTGLLDHYLGVSRAATTHLVLDADVEPKPHNDAFADPQQAIAWLEAERVNLMAVSDLATTLGHPAGADLSFVLLPFLRRRRYIEDAIALASNSVRSFREAGERVRQHQALCNLGTVLVDGQRFQGAVDALTAAVALCEESGESEAKARALLNLGTALTLCRRFDEALTALDSAGGIFKEVGSIQDEAQTLCNLGSTLIDTGRLDLAVKALNTADALFRRGGNLSGEVQVLSHMGRALSRMGHHDEAIKALRYQLAICEEIDDDDGRAVAWNGLGTELVHVGRFTEAAEAFRTATAIYTEMNDPRFASSALGNLGAVLRSLGQFDQAIEVLTAATAACREARDPDGERTMLLNLAVTHNERWMQHGAEDTVSRYSLFRAPEDPELHY
ncbi:ATP-binding protein [Streptomyces sp. NPDC059278]|uniref:ATP-binding protein n=1 Tax=Streptomyces sp. NPDC059278 TaxID=3346801 RepID=UPI0036A026F4